MFGYTINVVITNNLSKSLESRKSPAWDIDITATSGLHICNPDESISWIFLEIGKNINCIAHESYHAASRIAEWCGVKKDEELMAYMVGWITGEIVFAYEEMQEEWKITATKEMENSKDLIIRAKNLMEKKPIKKAMVQKKIRRSK